MNKLDQSLDQIIGSGKAVRKGRSNARRGPYKSNGGGGGGGGRGSSFGVPVFLAHSNMAQKIRNNAGQGCIVYVGNLPWAAKWQELKDLCAPYGAVGRCDVEENAEGKSAGYGLAVFENRKDANKCINGLNGSEYEGRELEVRVDSRAQGTYDRRGQGGARRGGGGGGGGASNQSFEDGDWNCPDCGDHQFARNTECRLCGAGKPGGGGGARRGGGAGRGGGGGTSQTFEDGDWNCPACGDHQFARNVVCRLCKARKPGGGGGAKWKGAGGGGSDQTFEDGDWNCPACGDHQFARNTECRMCKTAKPGGRGAGGRGGAKWKGGGGGGGGGSSQTFEDGDWNCPDCGDHQFARNTECRLCGAPQP